MRASGRRRSDACDLDELTFATVDTEAKAYLLGWLAAAGTIDRDASEVRVDVRDKKDKETLRALRQALCLRIPLRRRKETVGLVLASARIVAEVCGSLDVSATNDVATFPEHLRGDLGWAFVRGVFDRTGSITPARATKKAKRGAARPRCSLASASDRMLDAIEEFCATPARRDAGRLEWTGPNAIDFMARLYDGAAVALRSQRDRYLEWSVWVPALGEPGSHGRGLRFRWVRCLPEAVGPRKAHASDSGYDLGLVAMGKRAGRVQFYRTGIKIQPAHGWYFDLVPRSSIAKTGYLLANSVGVIDRSYIGEVIVPLIKIDPDAPDLELPARIVQIVPRPIVHAEFMEVESFEESRRGEGGFGSTGVGQLPSSPTERASTRRRARAQVPSPRLIW